MLINGNRWKDTEGNYIQAHGGCIIKHEGIWYWYGEHKGKDNTPGTRHVDIIGVSCYKSKNLVDWEYCGIVLSPEPDTTESSLHPSQALERPEVILNEKTGEFVKLDTTVSPLHPSQVLERPKVIFNEKTGKFVMWMHLDSNPRLLASAGVAVADSPQGPFTLIKVMRPNGQALRDMTLFKDGDKAYLIFSTDRNKTMSVTLLSEDYTDVTDKFALVMKDQSREAPAVCKKDGTYYMVTSGCTGWDPNSALYSKSDEVMGIWRLIDNPCEGENYRKTFDGQSTYIFEEDGKFYLMLDHWKAYELKNSGYSILPIEFDESTVMSIKWQQEWTGIKQGF